ncbi:hypothetical protein CALVIDRAFT_554559 [Calocera viscosa TUFC12733]|uniref:Uncharacterized protein n=1 Tax=Calocera viscosa (strain TUFC12733) TaxID=1330018 RepID=A0A167N2G4_CALVF|nr:hypothetical protein CALVIDRAFT_554559 [Calocera viscosa TUFC12733]
MSANHHTTLVVPNDPSPEAQLRLRSSHLKHAVDLFGMLNSVMDSTVANRRNITHSTDPDVKVSDDAAAIHRIEVDLARRFRVLHVAKNEAMAFCHRLPDDILMHIFQIPFEEEWPNQVRWSITMSHVCGKWRRIAIRTAALWAMVCFASRPSLPAHVRQVERTRYDDGRYRRRQQWSNAQMLTFLLRSRGAGLAAELKLGQDVSVVGRFVDQCANRTDDLTFTFQQTCAHPRTMETILPCMDVLGGHLRRLKISFPSFTDYDSGGHMAPLFRTPMPCLEEAVFHNVPLSRHNGDYPMLATCKRLCIVAGAHAYFSPEVLVALLRSAQHLRELRIDISTSWLMPPGPTQSSFCGERVLLPNLAKYVVATGAWMERAFEFFAAPRLRWLEMDTERCEIPPYTFDAPIYEFLAVSKPPIETFVVRHVSTFVLHLLRRLPTVRRIAFLSAEADYGAAYKQVLEVMTQSIYNLEGGSCICPKLESWSTDLELDESHLYKLIDFAAARNAHGCRVERIIFKPSFHWDMKLHRPASPMSSSPFSDGSDSPRSDSGSPGYDGMRTDDVYESGYRRTPTPELWLDYLDPEPVRGDKLLAQEVGQFIMASRMYDLQTDHWEDDNVVRPEERFFDEHMTRRDGLAAKVAQRGGEADRRGPELGRATYESSQIVDSSTYVMRLCERGKRVGLGLALVLLAWEWRGGQNKIG